MGYQETVKETYTECQSVEDGGTDPYKAIMVSEPSLDPPHHLPPSRLTALPWRS